MFQIELRNPLDDVTNPFKIVLIPFGYTPPVDSGNMFIVWMWDDDDI
jgi:hypothetical protein